MERRSEKNNLIEGETGPWEVVIGLEVHAQVTSKAKLFSGASTEFGAEPNTHVSLVDAAMPGMLPVINEDCVEQAVRTGLGLKAQINLRSVFDRKNYFYPDLPQGYQISQYKSPIVGKGEVIVDLPERRAREVGIERLHLEQDAGKSLHDQHPEQFLCRSQPLRRGADGDRVEARYALVRGGRAPMSPSCARSCAISAPATAIWRKARCAPTSMSRCASPGEPLGTRCEIKNVNSIRFIGQAIEHEARRQIEIIEDGGTIHQETRLFDAKTGETRSMRSKEEAHDYRYFPDPDLLPLELDASLCGWARESACPSCPTPRSARFIADFGLSPYDADVLVAEREAADYFEAVAKGRDAKQAANWVINELFGRLNKEGRSIVDSPCRAGQLGAILDLIKDGTISGKIAKDVFDIVGPKAAIPRAIVEARGLHPGHRHGRHREGGGSRSSPPIPRRPSRQSEALDAGWFVGQVMKATGGKASPQSVNELLKKKLGIE